MGQHRVRPRCRRDKICHFSGSSSAPCLSRDPAPHQDLPSLGKLRNNTRPFARELGAQRKSTKLLSITRIAPSTKEYMQKSRAVPARGPAPRPQWRHDPAGAGPTAPPSSRHLPRRLRLQQIPAPASAGQQTCPPSWNTFPGARDSLEKLATERRQVEKNCPVRHCILPRPRDLQNLLFPGEPQPKAGRTKRCSSYSTRHSRERLWKSYAVPTLRSSSERLGDGTPSTVKSPVGPFIL